MNEQKYFDWDTIKTTRNANRKTRGSGTISGTKISDSEFTKFIKLLSDKLGFKLNKQNIRFLNAWRKAENTKALNNPFATTINYTKDPGMSKINLANSGQGVKNFSTIEYGVDATAKTMSLSYYKSLIEKLKNPASTAEELAMEPSLRTWGTTSRNPKLILSLLPGANLDEPNTVKSTESAEWFAKSVPEIESIFSMMESFILDGNNWIDFKGSNDDEEGALNERLGPWLRGTIQPLVNTYYKNWIQPLEKEGIYTKNMYKQDFDWMYASDLGQLKNVYDQYHRKLIQNYLILKAQCIENVIIHPTRWAAYWNWASRSSQYTLPCRLYYGKTWYLYYWDKNGKKASYIVDADI